jgi:hypothetical protein
MKRNTLIEHKKVVVCEESGLLNLNYNVLLPTPKVNTIIKLVIPTITTKSTLTCTNCGKIGHFMETCHNMKREVLVVPITIVKSIEPIVGTKTQLVKSQKIPTCYPCIICSNVKRRSEECLRKIEI